MPSVKSVVAKALGWEAEYSLKEGIARTYAWIEEQVKAARERELTSREPQIPRISQIL